MKFIILHVIAALVLLLAWAVMGASGYAAHKGEHDTSRLAASISAALMIAAFILQVIA